MLDAFKLKEFDLEPALDAWKNPPRFLGNPKKDPTIDTWLDQVKQGCIERKIPKEYWHKVGQRFLGDKARKRLDELKEVLRNLHGGNYRWDWKKFKIAMRNMGWDIDDKKTESVKVQTKSSSGLWWIVGRDKQEVSEEPAEIKVKSSEKKKPSATRRATFSESPTTEKPIVAEKAVVVEKPVAKRRATWLTRSPSNASTPSATTPENGKEIVKVEPTTTTSSFWKLNLASSSTNTPTSTVANAPATSVVSTAAAAAAAATSSDAVTTTEAHAPLWLLNACNALEFLTTEHPKVMTTLSAVLITVGSLPALPALSAGAGGTILASHAVQAAGAIAVGVGNWLKAAQDSAAAKAVTETQPGGHTSIEDASHSHRR
ncbi:hypothetical protein B0F90DRAFT_1668804 [Multifurca ochricompacta]|uniref:Uncharacterized protein n=1 Tax=Multifurca ochricompacta TaxID=376703 RepID=A0AAD4QJY7_9AGAM|nr:hypothetical protein B0F90DRAFT_1668804 [Multifurca ochricompacta]